MIVNDIRGSRLVFNKIMPCLSVITGLLDEELYPAFFHPDFRLPNALETAYFSLSIIARCRDELAGHLK